MKTKSRLGKTDSIFARTTSGPSKEVEAVTAPAGSSIDNKLTVILPPDQVAFLDSLCLAIRGKTRSKMRRTEIIRALVAGVRDSKIDLTDFGTEADIAAAIQKRLS